MAHRQLPSKSQSSPLSPPIPFSPAGHTHEGQPSSQGFHSSNSSSWIFSINSAGLSTGISNCRMKPKCFWLPVTRNCVREATATSARGRSLGSMTSFGERSRGWESVRRLDASIAASVVCRSNGLIFKCGRSVTAWYSPRIRRSTARRITLARTYFTICPGTKLGFNNPEISTLVSRTISILFFPPDCLYFRFDLLIGKFVRPIKLCFCLNSTQRYLRPHE